MTANDSDVSDGDTLTGSQVVRIYGDNLTPPFVKLTLGDVEYTPLDFGEGYVEYVLQDNGTYIIRNDYDYVMEFAISGAAFPTELTTWRRMGFREDDQASSYGSGVIEPLESIAKCLNYPKITDGEYNFIFSLTGNSTAPVEADFAYYNCSLNNVSVSNKAFTGNVSVQNIQQVAYITYRGYIVFVFNYTTE